MKDVNRARPLVLVVDDEPLICEIMTDLLASAGYATCCARNGEEALTSIDRERPALVLSDVWMPKMDGLTLIGRLRLRADAPPVILMSAYTRESPVPSVPVIAKPFDLDRVLMVVAETLAGATVGAAVACT